MKPKKQSSANGKIRAKQKAPGKARSKRANTRGDKPTAKVVSHSLNLIVGPNDKCQISEGVASAPGMTVPSARTLRIWAARLAAGVAVVKAIIEDGEPVLAFVEQLVGQIVA